MTALYNEIDEAAAHVLRHMIALNVIAPGEVVTTSIKDLTPNDLKGFTQVHLFAGGGLWSVAARLAGWPDDEPLWTASCPCQPFSAAGKGAGTDDPRHLWPDVYRLASALRPAVIMGEQVAQKAGYGWFDGVRADLENEGYASRSVDFPACSVDAPHQRNRQYWCAVSGLGLAEPYEFDGRTGAGREHGAEAFNAHDAIGSGVDLVDSSGFGRGEGRAKHELRGGRSTAASADASGVTQGDAFGSGLEGQRGHGNPGGRPEQDRPVAEADVGERGTMADRSGEPGQQDTGSPSGNETAHGRAGRDRGEQDSHNRHHGHDESRGLHADADSSGRARRAEGQIGSEIRGAAVERDLLRNGTYWSDAEWITCHDDKARRAKPGLRFLAHGIPGRVDLWRIGGNAIVPEAAKEVIAAFIDVYGLPSTWEAAE